MPTIDQAEVLAVDDGGRRDRPTLYMMLADWRGPENARAMMADRMGKVLAVTAPARRACWP